MAEEVTIEIPVVVPEKESVMASAEESVLQVALSGMAQEGAAASSRRTNRADQLAGDSAAMWSVALTTPTVFAGMGFRVAQQSGGYPADTGTGTGGKP